MSRPVITIGPLAHLQGISIDQLPAGAKGITPELDETNEPSEPSASLEAPFSSSSSSRPSTKHSKLFRFSSRSSSLRAASSSQGSTGDSGDLQSLQDGDESTTDTHSLEDFRIVVPPRQATLADLVTNVLEEACDFISSMAPKSGVSAWKLNGSPKHLSSIDATVQLLECKIPGKQLDSIPGRPPHWVKHKSSEFWAGCISCHPNAATSRSCTFEELVYYFKDRHLESQEVSWKNFETVAREAMLYDTSQMEVVVHGEKWSNITVEVAEMIHTFDMNGFQPLKGRVYAVLEVTARKSQEDEFMIATIPIIDFQRSPFSKHIHNKSLEKATYVAIQRARILKETNEVECAVATAINFKGVIPSFALNRVTANRMWQLLQCILEWIVSIRNKPRDMWVD